MRLAPQLARGLLAVADIEPQEEAAARREVAEAVVQDLLGDAEILAVPFARLDRMGLLAPQRRRGLLHGEGNLRAAIAAPAQHHGHQLRVARHEARAQAGRIGALRQRMEDREVMERVLAAGLVDRKCRLQRARRHLTGINLGVTLIDGQHCVVLATEPQQLLDILDAGDGALRIGRRAEIDHRHAPPRRLVDLVEFRQVAVFDAGIDQQRFGAREYGATQIGLIERIGQGHDRLAAALHLRRADRRDDVDAFLAARRRMDMPVGVEQAGRQPVAPGQPLADRQVEVGQALVGRIAVPAVDLVVDDLAREGGHRALRLADRHVDRRQMRRRRDRSQKSVQPREREIGQGFGEARIEHPEPSQSKKGRPGNPGRFNYSPIL